MREGIVQGERALAHLGHAGGDAGAHDPYGEGSFPRPYLPGEDKGQVPGGADEGQGSLTQADATPGEEPTKKPGGGA